MDRKYVIIIVPIFHYMHAHTRYLCAKALISALNGQIKQQSQEGWMDFCNQAVSEDLTEFVRGEKRELT